VPSIALEALQSSVPQFAAAAILGESSLGLIKATQQITNILNLPLNALQQILPSLAATKLSRSGYAGMVKFLKKSGYLIALVSVSLGILVVAASSVVAAMLSIDDNSLFRWLLALFVLLNLILSLRIPSLILVGAVEDPLANFVATGAGFINAAVLSYILLVSIGEIAVPIIGITNAILVWIALKIWAHKKNDAYRMSFGG
jgi:O-antigen/teichoic acid export membrane protein